MRRKEREIGRREEIEEVIHQAAVCHLAMSDAGRPYVVPLCFAYEEGVFYFHSAPEGLKLAILEKNPAVCGGGPRCLDSLMGGLSSESVFGFL